MLVPKNADGVELVGNFDPSLIDLSKSVYIDWGAFIMAIITFLLTALVLFFILKAVTSVQKGFGSVKGELGLLSSEEAEELRRQGKSRKEIKAILEQRAAEKKAAEEAAAAAAAPETRDHGRSAPRDTRPPARTGSCRRKEGLRGRMTFQMTHLLTNAVHTA